MQNTIGGLRSAAAAISMLPVGGAGMKLRLALLRAAKHVPTILDQCIVAIGKDVGPSQAVLDMCRD
eukprot:3658317-Amphidinium_carterae.1